MSTQKTLKEHLFNIAMENLPSKVEEVYNLMKGRLEELTGKAAFSNTFPIVNGKTNLNNRLSTGDNEKDIILFEQLSITFIDALRNRLIQEGLTVKVEPYMSGCYDIIVSWN